MPVMDSGGVAERARQRELVRRGYDAISLAYRSDDGDAAPSSEEDVSRYADWVAELAGLLQPGAMVVDLGCGAGIPATRDLTRHGLQVLGVSAVQLRRLSGLPPRRRWCRPTWPHFTCGRQTPTPWCPSSPDPSAGRRPARLVRSHPPLAPPRRLLPAITGAEQWTGTEPYLGAEMFWDHADTATYLRWLRAEQLSPLSSRYIPEGDSGHNLILARAP
jgi:hypothetical protein